MSDLAGALRRLTLALAVSLISAGVYTAAADAQSYGELEHFGSAGTAPGQFEPSEEASAIGVDPTDNSIYTVDLPDENGEYRIQKFSEKGTLLASTTFKPKDPVHESPDIVEGIAVDPSMKRIYLLVSELRPEGKTLDPGDPAAGQLYAFSTETSGKTIEPAAGTEGGVLAATTVFSPFSPTVGKSLLYPNGITVDPTTHDIVIVGEVETAAEEQAIALERVNDKGELGQRWVDTSEYFNGEGASSPAVTKSGNVYVDYFGQLDEIPGSFSEDKAPTPVIQLTKTEKEEQEEVEKGIILPEQQLVFIPGAPEPTQGGSLSISEDGTIYSKASIVQELGGQKIARYPGVLEFNEAHEELGWTGGQSVATSPSGACLISYDSAAQIAAGKNGDVFVFDTSTTAPRIVEFGPGGGGCESDSATKPAAKVNGNPVPESEAIPIGDTVALSSSLTQANALSVEWNFGDGAPVTKVSNRFQTTEVTHKFIKSSKTPLEITETIHTDDLAEPLIVAHSKILIHPETPVAETDTTAPVVGSTTATVAGTVDPDGKEVTECKFEYGTTTSYGASAECSKKPGSGQNTVPVTGAISGLTEHTTYHYRLVAKNAAGPGEGEDRTFVTGPAPAVVTEAASGTTTSSATLTATVNPEGANVEQCVFEYGSTPELGSSVECAARPGSGREPVSVSAPLSGLAPGTTYYYRVLAKTLSGTVQGETKSFQTQSPENIGAGGGETTATTPPPPPPPPPVPAVPAVKIGPVSTVSTSGSFTVTLTCPTGQTSCSGSVTLKTLKAVVAAVGHAAKGKPKAAILTLSSGSFELSGGQHKTVTLRLSSAARALLAKTHSIIARVTMVAHNPQGESATSTGTLTLKPAKAAKKKK
jgi:hypothetical protein